LLRVYSHPLIARVTVAVLDCDDTQDLSCSVPTQKDTSERFSSNLMCDFLLRILPFSEMNIDMVKKEKTNSK
jgi:hypothetical protein